MSLDKSGASKIELGLYDKVWYIEHNGTIYYDNIADIVVTRQRFFSSQLL